MDIGSLRALITVILFVAFISLWIWAWSSKRRADFEQAARLPLDEDAAGIEQGERHE
jgi:cytochrome c oxidase cbb3-type subunit 4